MRIHHLDCVTSCPLGGFIMDGQSKSLRGRLACHCLLVEDGSNLILVDTGYGLHDVASPRSRLSPFFLALLAPELREEMTAVRQIEALGFDPRDVRHIVLTHLDFDHAGGLDDFPHATVHMLAAERDAAMARRTTLDRMRYRPEQWSTSAAWRAYEYGTGDEWFGFDRVRVLDGVTSDIALVPLIGHTYGHAGVAVRRDEGWLLLAGDAYFDHREMDVNRPRCTPGLRFYQTMMEKDRSQRRRNQRRLRALAREHGAEVAILSSHDRVEFEQYAQHPLDVPAQSSDAKKRAISFGANGGTSWPTPAVSQ